jgi:hypothetical protein
MLKRIRHHAYPNYACRGSTLLKPKRLTAADLDIRDDHLQFLHGRIPTNAREMYIHALLVHENVHSVRQERWAWWYCIRYRYSRSFRLQEEMIAYEAQIVQQIEYGVPVFIDYFANLISSKLYGNIISFDDARAWFRSLIVREADIDYMFFCLAAEEEFGKRSAQVTAAHPVPIRTMSFKSWLIDRVALVVCALIVFAIETAWRSKSRKPARFR